MQFKRKLLSIDRSSFDLSASLGIEMRTWLEGRGAFKIISV
jgi:hypothetical protein